MLKLARSIAMVKGGSSFPFSAAIDLTDRCNFRCSICNIWAKRNKADLDAHTFREQFKKSKVLEKLSILNFGGGEPFILDNLDHFVETAAVYAKPLQVRFVTNGFMTEKIYKTMRHLLQKYNVSFGVKISIDGMNDAHDAIRGVRGAFEKAMNTLDALLGLREMYKKRLAINVGFTITSANYKDLSSVHELCSGKKVGFFCKPVIDADKFCNGNFDNSLLLNEEHAGEVVRFGKSILKNLEGFTLKEKVIYKLYYGLQNKFLSSPKRHIPCYAGSASFYMTPDGNVTPCFARNEIMGNIVEEGFDAIWFSESSRLLRKKIKSMGCSCLTSCDTIPSLLVHKFPFYF